MKIKIISGTYGHRPAGAVHPKPISAGETCDVPEGEAKRLIDLGIALPVAQVPAKGIATAPAASARLGPGVTMSEGKNPQEAFPFEDGEVLDVVDGHLTVESLMKLSRADMESLAEGAGVDVSGCKTKADVAAELAKVEFDPPEPGDGEALPEIGAEAPIV